MLQRRSGFTLIEMLVAMTLTLFIMVIVTQAFIAGLETFRTWKGIGDLQETLRMAGQRIQADLKAQHFDANRHLGDPAFNSQGKVRYGFFRIVQGSAFVNSYGAPFAPYQKEGVDLDYNAISQPSPASYRATNHFLHFTINLRGDRPENFFAASLPVNSPLANPANTSFFGQPGDASFQAAGTYSTQWAEIVYYLVQTGTTDNPAGLGGTGTPLFSLYRVQRLVVPRNDMLQQVSAAGQPQTPIPANAANVLAYSAFSCQSDANGKLYFNTPEDLAAPPGGSPYKRSFPTTLPATVVAGAALVLTNVVSFQVQVSQTGLAFTDLPAIASYSTVATAAVPGVFDTAGTLATVPVTNPPRLAALQVTLRMWDPESLLTKQVTLVQDM